jgi:hypothetical protein
MIETALRGGSALRCMGTCVVALAMVAEGTVQSTRPALGLPGRIAGPSLRTGRKFASTRKIAHPINHNAIKIK